MKGYNDLRCWEVDGTLINKWLAGGSDFEYEEGRLYTIFENGDIKNMCGKNKLMENTGMPLNSSDFKELGILEEEFFFVCGYYDEDMDMDQTGVILVEPKLLTLEEALKEPVFASIDDYFSENKEWFGYNSYDDVEFYELANYKKAEVMEKYEESDELYYCNSFDNIDDAKKDLENIKNNEERFSEELAYKFIEKKEKENKVGEIIELYELTGMGGEWELSEVEPSVFENILAEKEKEWFIYGERMHSAFVDFEVVKEGKDLHDTEVKITGYRVVKDVS